MKWDREDWILLAKYHQGRASSAAWLASDSRQDHHKKFYQEVASDQAYRARFYLLRLLEEGKEHAA